jgi:FkbM family methyltransferase
MATWNEQFNNERYEGSTTFISPINKFFSQYNQDRSLKNCIFKEHQNGIFVDVGAHDGVDLNNTLFFETNYNWRGINIEPINSVYNRLVTNRPKCININCAVSDTDGFAEFVCNEGYTEMLSGLKSEYDDRHLNRISDENKKTGSISQVINIQTKRLETICRENNINHINYLSIDVEGGEFKVINSINFDNLFIDVIGFENNYHDTQDICINYLKSKGYLKLPDHVADIFMIHKESKFLKDVNLN